MKMVPDDDVIRGLGFVSLFSGHLESQINYVLDLLSIREEFRTEERTSPISQRIVKAERLVKGLEGNRKEQLLSQLEIAKKLFMRRNGILHSSIYSAPYGILEPGLALVAEDDHGVAGFVVGTWIAKHGRDGWSGSGGRR